MKQTKVAVTGMGVLCSLGNGLDSVWGNLVDGKSGISTISNIDLSRQSVRIGAEVKDFIVDEDLLDAKNRDRYDRFLHFALQAAKEALGQARLEVGRDYKAHRVGAILGVGMGGLPHMEKNYDRFLQKGQRGVSPFFIPSIIPNMATGLLGLAFGFQGPHFSVSGACASAGQAITLACREILSGRVSAMISGGTESVLSNLPYGGFTNMKALSKRMDAPEAASRPFDKERDGFVMGEGAGVLILENHESAQARGATIFAEILGHGLSGDAHHITAPHPQGEGAARCMKQALDEAHLPPEAVDYINAHGTSTEAGDICEVKAIKTVFGGSAEKIKVSSTKSMTGHLLGAAGGLESIACVQALHTDTVPPTINLENLDPACEGVGHVAMVSRKENIRYALNNSFGFGGTNSSILFGKGA